MSHHLSKAPRSFYYLGILNELVINGTPYPINLTAKLLYEVRDLKRIRFELRQEEKRYYLFAVGPETEKELWYYTKSTLPSWIKYRL